MFTQVSSTIGSNTRIWDILYCKIPFYYNRFFKLVVRFKPLGVFFVKIFPIIIILLYQIYVP